MTGRRAAPFHWATGMAMGVLAWILLMIGHEVVGHGSGCVAAGGEGLYFDAMYFECSEITDSVANRFYIAAGSAFNVLLGGAAVLLLWRSAPPARWFAYFLWITAAFNFLQGGSYIAFGRFIHPGMDWARIWNDTASKGRWMPSRRLSASGSSPLESGSSVISSPFFLPRRTAVGARHNSS